MSLCPTSGEHSRKNNGSQQVVLISPPKAGAFQRRTRPKSGSIGLNPQNKVAKQSVPPYPKCGPSVSAGSGRNPFPSNAVIGQDVRKRIRIVWNDADSAGAITAIQTRKSFAVSLRWFPRKKKFGKVHQPLPVGILQLCLIDQRI